MPNACLLFDLDGTLVDSLPDLTTAINLLRADLDLLPLSLSRVRLYVGDGATALVKRALPEGHFNQEKLTRFLSYYRQNLCQSTRPYPGIPAMLAKLDHSPLAVITNKPLQMATELLEKLGLAQHFQLIIGGDSFSNKKPHPQPLLEALRQLNADNQTSLMIGDHHTDLRAAFAAGIPACFCNWGYGNDGGEAPAFSATSVADLDRLLVNR